MKFIGWRIGKLVKKKIVEEVIEFIKTLPPAPKGVLKNW